MTSVHRAATAGQSDSKIVGAAVQAATTAAKANGVSDPLDLANIVSQASATAVADGKIIFSKKTCFFFFRTSKLFSFFLFSFY